MKLSSRARLPLSDASLARPACLPPLSTRPPHQAKLSKELASFLKGLDFKATAAPVDESDDEEDAGDASDDAEESDEGEMPLDVPMKVKEPVAAPAAAEAEAAGPSLKEKRDKLAEATKAAKEKAAAAPVAPVKGKKGEVVSLWTLLPPTSFRMERHTLTRLSFNPSPSPQIFPPIPQWYFHAVPELAAKPLPTLTAEKLAFLGQRSNALLAAVPSAPSSSLASKSDANFMAQILKSGTQADKLSALILQVQGDPLRNISALESLRAMTGWKEGGAVGRMGGREERISVVRAVADWWNGGGAPNRKLRWVMRREFQRRGARLTNRISPSGIFATSRTSCTRTPRTRTSRSGRSRTGSRSTSSHFFRSSRYVTKLSRVCDSIQC